MLSEPFSAPIGAACISQEMRSVCTCLISLPIIIVVALAQLLNKAQLRNDKKKRGGSYSAKKEVSIMNIFSSFDFVFLILTIAGSCFKGPPPIVL